VREVGLPAVIKPYRSWVVRDGRGIRWPSEAVETEDKALSKLAELLSAGGRALLQQWLPGRREAVSLFYARDRFWARMAQVSYREWPIMGGASVLCETLPLETNLVEPAGRLVRAMNLEGCSMVEFRRDAQNQPVLMEVNPRMGGSVTLAINAGVNFPKLLHDWKLGYALEPVSSYRVGRRLRWLTGDIWNIKTVIERQGQLDVPHGGGALATFIFDFFRGGTELDLIELGDPGPALLEFDRAVLHHVRSRLRKLRTAPASPELLIPNPGKVN